METKLSLPKDFLSSGVSCGIKGQNKLDLALIYSPKSAVSAAVFTKNKCKAAPVILSEKKIKNNSTQAIIVNSGNANAATGSLGVENAELMCKWTAKYLDIPEDNVLVCSTGSIGKQLPIDKIHVGISECVQTLSEEGDLASQAILTTDKNTKVSCVQLMDHNEKIEIVSLAKGAGMIEPNMATMLCFILTDIAISSNLLQDALKDAVNASFNKISVDGDMSTNDSVIILANGSAGNEIVKDKKDVLYISFKESLIKICIDLAIKIVSDGEGATKCIDIQIQGAQDDKQADTIAKRIAHSPLVKAAMFGEVAAWGRVIGAIGSCDGDIQQGSISISMNQLKLFHQGEICLLDPIETENLLKNKEILIDIDLGIGSGMGHCWTSDLTHEYIEINCV